MSRSSLITLSESTFLTGGRRTTAEKVRTFCAAIIAEMLNIPDDLTSAPGAVAYPGGGQTNATVVANRLTRIDTCATTGDSVKFDTAVPKNQRTVFNGTVNDAEVFPPVGERFRTMDGLLAIDEPITLGSGNQLAVYCLSGESGVYTKI